MKSDMEKYCGCGVSRRFFLRTLGKASAAAAAIPAIAAYGQHSPRTDATFLQARNEGFGNRGMGEMMQLSPDTANSAKKQMNPILHKYELRTDAAKSLLCVGLDPVLSQIPERFRAAKFPLFEFNKWIIEQTAKYTSAYKPNMAFYEARGVQGLIELESTVQYLRASYPEIVTICDAKRGDVSNTNKAYVVAIFDSLNFDAVTLHPYLGKEALEPFLARRDKLCIVLCRTSNAGAGEFQDLESSGKPLWQTVADRVANNWDTDGNCMLVVGAPYLEDMRKIRSIAPHTTFLVPGIGALGDVPAVVSAGLSVNGRGLILTCSNEIIFSADPAAAARCFRDAINKARYTINATRGKLRHGSSANPYAD